MSGDHTKSRTARSATTGPTGRLALILVVFRAVAALLLAPSAVLKLVDHGARAAFFAELGVPAPAVTVVLVAVVELVAAVLLATGVQARAGAVAAIPVMLVAMGLVGVVATNAAVLVACVGVVALGPGPYALRDGETDVVERLVATVR